MPHCHRAQGRLPQVIRHKLPAMKLQLVDDSSFSHLGGLEEIDLYCVRNDAPRLKQSIPDRSPAPACIAALFHFLRSLHKIEFLRHSIKMEWLLLDDVVHMNFESISDLNLIENFLLHQREDRSLLRKIGIEGRESFDDTIGHLDHAKTTMGHRCLRRAIARPSTQSDMLSARLDAIEELANESPVLKELQVSLGAVNDLDQKLATVSFRCMQDLSSLFS